MVHGRSSVPLAVVGTDRASIGVEDKSLRGHGQQSRYQVALCLAKRDPAYNALAPVIGPTHALWDHCMPRAVVAKCVKVAHL